MKTKICSKCKIEKPIDNFYPRTNRINQFFSYCKLCQKVLIKENPEKRKKVYTEYNQSHKSAAKKYYEDNKEKILKRFKKYRTNNKIKINNLNKKYVISRLKVDIDFRLRYSLRSRLYVALKGFCKSKSTMKLIGCSIEQLKHHLEKQFKLGMSWDNYGKWHIDHKIPCASFNLSKPEEQRKCFNYTNLQPLWAVENLRKSSKIY